MEQDDRTRSDEEIKRDKEANDSELTDQDLENVSGGGIGNVKGIASPTPQG